MSVLTTCQDVADEIGIAQPATIIGNTDPTAVRLLRNFIRVGTTLARKNLHRLIKEATITTSSGEPQYNLPTDFRAFVNETMWNRTTARQVFMISPQRWQYEKASVTSSFYDRFRLIGDDSGPDVGRRITLHPTPSAVETIAYEYYSENWLTDSGGTTEKSAPTTDSDMLVLDENLVELGLIWRMLKTMGEPYIEEKVDFDRQLEIALANTGGMENLHADGDRPTLSNIPETGFGT